MSEAQSARVMTICKEIQETQERLEQQRLRLREELRELFSCGPRMSREVQLKFLADLFFELKESH